MLNRHFSTIGQTTLSILALWLIAYVVSAVYTRFACIADIPGPFWAAYSRFWLSRGYSSGCLWKVYHDVSSRYGTVTRIGPNRVLLSDPEETMRILSSRSRYERGPWYDAFKIEPDRSNIISQRDRPRHLHMRFQMAPGYNGKDIADFEGILEARIADLMDHIHADWVSPADSTIPFDIGKWIRHMTMDTITHLSFGRPIGYVDQDRDVMQFTSVMEELLPVVLHFSLFTELNQILKALGKIDFLKKNLFPHHTHTKGLGVVRRIIKEVIASRPRPTPDSKTDMVNSFLKHGLSATEVEAEMAIGLVAGSDTTSTGLRATLLPIISNPPVYRKLQREIDEAIAEGRVSLPIKDTEARRLPYLQACIQEGLRCHPPLVLARERIVPPEGDVLCGYKLPAGTIVGMNVWTSQRNAVFGKDAEIFRPERWLEASEQQLRSMKKVWSLIFGHGTTKCLGENLALTTMNKVIPELFRRFDMATINPDRPWQSECYGVFFQKDFNIRITVRETS
ncbi:cytochrome P450 oxidoreductase [Massarina eburnea CBS 473.64]|uniref:Cytochrome P450 oxidoreductase n=1 Tax=Massarina eburnea CBS 473.64 TaxID=1395130 RepID=A0A6A6S624_9PLEO|nr:cytochrome P450 oxidoreductase [Massarina eburnea CBS 473.64]